MAKFNSENVIEAGKKVLFFVLLLAVINVIVMAFIGIGKTINVTDWEVTELPQANSLYAYTYTGNSSSTSVTEPTNWEIQLDTNGEPVHSDSYLDYADTEKKLGDYVVMPMLILDVVLGGLLLLSILLEIFGINVGSMIGGATSSGKKRRSYN